jgi:hypothetical protein
MSAPEIQYIGDTVTVEFEAKLDDGTVLDLTGATLRAAIRQVGSETAIYAGSTTAVSPAATSGKWRATWTAAQTAAFQASEYEYDGLVILADGSKYHTGEGSILFEAPIST